MSLSARTNDHSESLHPKSVHRLVHFWRDWIKRRRTIAELNCCGPSEVAHMAHDIGVSSADLCVLAGKWPSSTDLLLRRMAETRLDASEITHVEPQVIRDLQRVCTLCASKRKCEHDLATNPSDPVWQDYCPNATTLQALIAERANPGNAKAV
jgi:uncharacterized protein YjiS (DUF1127 family)